MADEFNQSALTTQFKDREILSTLILVQRANKSDQLTNSELTFRRTHPYIVWSESGPSTRAPGVSLDPQPADGRHARGGGCTPRRFQSSDLRPDSPASAERRTLHGIRDMEHTVGGAAPRRRRFASVEFVSIHFQQEPTWPRGHRVVRATLGDAPSTGTGSTRTIGQSPIQMRLTQG